MGIRGWATFPCCSFGLKHRIGAGLSCDILSEDLSADSSATRLHLSQVKHVRVKCLAEGHRHRNNVPMLKGDKRENLPQAGFEPARQVAAIAKRHVVTIVPRPSP